MENSILVLDFGSQYTQLIGRKIRELSIYAEIHPYRITISEIKNMNPAGIVLSGGPSSIYAKKAPLPSKEIFELGIPILGICYGLQYITDFFQGKVVASKHREYGFANLKVETNDDLLKGLSNPSKVWMSHGDRVEKVPSQFKILATTESSPCAVIRHKTKHIYGLQFHPEVAHSAQGKIILKNFSKNICKLKPNWTMKNFAQNEIDQIRQLVGNERVMLGVSGGVDSLVSAKIIDEAIGKQLSCVYIDNGLMRQNETEQIKASFAKFFDIPLHIVKAGPRFLKELKDITEPEKKRKIIGRLFVEEFQRKAKSLGHHEFLAQGTLYTDIIESVSVKGPSQTIKSHHNRVPEILKLIKAGKIIEPLKELFKDEVRRLGLELKLPRELLFRHPFPGPGLAIRVLGNLSKKRLDLLRQADAIMLEELHSSRQYNKIWQAFAVFLPVNSVGVMGDKRTYENVIALRMVESVDGMTADFAKVPWPILAKISSRIINEVHGINRVVYDISSKPPATIEWE